MATNDILNNTGLQTKDYNVILSDLQTGLQNIYSPSGEEINFSSSSPDGQMTNILAEMGTVLREIITEVYNSTSPSNCSGAVQDIRYQINYLFRKGGTFTIQNIDITSDTTITLQGLDANYNNVNASAYSVSDNAGNLWYLIDTTTIYKGTTSLPFRAKELGEVIPEIDTITNQSTIVRGITKVNNSVGYTSLGEQQETDEEFRIRRERSVANASENNVDAIEGKLLQLDGVTDVKTWINKTNITDETGTEAHTLWTIINGGANTDIAQIIYANIGGAETKGSVEIPVNTVSGQTLTMRFDRPTVTPIYIKFNIQVLGDKDDINIKGLKEGLVEQIAYKIGQDASTSEITAKAMYSLNQNGGFSTSYITDLQIAKDKPTATVQKSSVTITEATVDAEDFAMQIQKTGEYIFTFISGEWKLEGKPVNIANYGLKIVGEASEGNTLTVNYTSSTWTNLLLADTKATLFNVDTSRIYTNVIEVG